MINILLFAHLQEALGESKLSVELSDVTVAQLKEWMEKRYPQLSLQQIMTAVNEEFATDTTIVKSGDTIAFIPPISGDKQEVVGLSQLPLYTFRIWILRSKRKEIAIIHKTHAQARVMFPESIAI